MNRSTDLEGTAEVLAVLSALPKNIQSNIVRGALRAGAKPVTELARTLAPKQTGAMAKGIKTGSPRNNGDGTVSVDIRPSGPHGFLALLHEFGTSPHMLTISDEAAGQIEARLGPSKKILGRARKTVVRYGNDMVREGSLKIGENFVGPSVSHPGHAAHPFLRPALDGAYDDAVAAFAQYIANSLEKRTGFNANLPEAA